MCEPEPDEGNEMPVGDAFMEEFFTPELLSDPGWFS